MAGVAGLIIGGAAGAWSSVLPAAPEPAIIAPEIFPKYIENLARPDLTSDGDENPARSAQLFVDLEAQRERYRFAYGGDGGAVDYGQFIMTIVNGSQPLPLPSDPTGTLSDASPFLISLESGTVSCTFRPEVALYSSAVLRTPADLSAPGWTQCVLNDAEHNISLKLDSQVPGGSSNTAIRYARILERAHSALLS